MYLISKGRCVRYIFLSIVFAQTHPCNQFLFLSFGIIIIITFSSRVTEEEHLRNMVVKVNDSSFGTESSEGTRSMTSGSFSTDFTQFTQRDASTFETAGTASFVSQVSDAFKNILPSLVSRPVYSRPYSESQDESAQSIRSLREQMRDRYSSRNDTSNSSSFIDNSNSIIDNSNSLIEWRCCNFRSVTTTLYTIYLLYQVSRLIEYPSNSAPIIRLTVLAENVLYKQHIRLKMTLYESLSYSTYSAVLLTST
jgi:hypothetical protein